MIRELANKMPEGRLDDADGVHGVDGTQAIYGSADRFMVQPAFAVQSPTPI